jgi:hypothetical protein
MQRKLDGILGETNFSKLLIGKNMQSQAVLGSQ